MSELIARHLRHAKAAGLSAQTIDDRRKLLHRLNRELPWGLVEATTEELASWLAGGCWAQETRATYYKHLVAFFRWATRGRQPWLDYDPTEDLDRPVVRLGDPLPAATEEQLHLALTGLPSPYDMVVAIAAYAGARAAEIAGLHRQDVTARSMLLHGKGGKDRLIPTHAAVWARVQPLPPGPLIVREKHPWRPADGDYVSSRIAVWLGRIGMPEITLHAFRRRFATIAMTPREFGGAGASLVTVSRLLGHANPVVTSRYLVPSERERDVCVAALPMYSPTPS